MAEHVVEQRCASCTDCYHPAFGPNTDGDPCPWCQDCGCHQDEHEPAPTSGSPA